MKYFTCSRMYVHTLPASISFSTVRSTPWWPTRVLWAVAIMSLTCGEIWNSRTALGYKWFCRRGCRTGNKLSVSPSSSLWMRQKVWDCSNSLGSSLSIKFCSSETSRNADKAFARPNLWVSLKPKRENGSAITLSVPLTCSMSASYPWIANFQRLTFGFLSASI